MAFRRVIARDVEGGMRIRYRGRYREVIEVGREYERFCGRPTRIRAIIVVEKFGALYYDMGEVVRVRGR